MKDAKPILWIQTSIEPNFNTHQEIVNKFNDYHVAITMHDELHPKMQVLNGEELTEQKYNALMEALKK